ncbi:MAG: ankyrin repeat domain-containing protein [Candidatus Protochlamydia sp.]|nr:ankyrin repeat domain-containing protein [Candidatus Protochlamydia sp.]
MQILNYNNNVELNFNQSKPCQGAVFDEIKQFTIELLNEEKINDDPTPLLEKINHLLPGEGLELKQNLFSRIFNIYKEYSIFYPCIAGNLDGLTYFLNEKNVNALDGYGNTCLILAAKNGHKSIVEFLIANGAHIRQPDDGKNTALVWAASNNHPEIVSLLLSSKEYSDWTKPEIEIEIEACLFWCAKEGHLNILKIFLNNPAFKNLLAPQALCGALKSTHVDVEIIKFILEIGVDLNAAVGGLTPLMRAVKIGRKDIVELLLKFPQNVSLICNDQSALRHAIHMRHPEIAKILIPYEKNLNTKNSKGATCLMLAARYGLKEIIEVLIEFGADINFQNQHGMTAIHWAVAENHSEIVNFLFEKGANLHTINTNNHTLYHDLKKQRLSGYKKILESIEKQEPRVQLINEVIIALKRIHHTCDIEKKSFFEPTNAFLEGKKIDLDGYSHLGWIDFMSTLTKKINTSVNSQLSALHEMLEFTLKINELDPQKILDRIQEGESTFIPTGWREHAETLVWQKGLLLIVNRNRQGHAPVDVYEYDSKKITIEHINLLINPNQMRNNETFKKNIADLINDIGGIKNDLTNVIEKACPFIPQNNGNCTWASPEAAILGFFLSNKKEEIKNLPIKSLEVQEIVINAKHLFIEWVFHARISSIELYLEASKEAGTEIDHHFFKKIFTSILKRSEKNLHEFKMGEVGNFSVYNKLISIIKEPIQLWKKELNL